MVSAFIFILLIVILILIIQLKGDLNSKITILQMLLEQLIQQQREDKPTAVSDPRPAAPPPVQELLPPVKEAPPLKARPLPPEKPMPDIPKVELSTPASAPEVPPIARPQAALHSSFRGKNPDLEKFIGENLFNKIGIAILVLGIGFFLKLFLFPLPADGSGRAALISLVSFPEILCQRAIAAGFTMGVQCGDHLFTQCRTGSYLGGYWRTVVSWKISG